MFFGELHKRVRRPHEIAKGGFETLGSGRLIIGRHGAVPYFRFPLPFGAACDSADPAAVFDFEDVLPSRRTLDAALAAFGPVFLPPLFAIRCHPPYN